MTYLYGLEAGADFESIRSRQFGIAYRMLGRVADAEDVVQDVWVRWQGVDHAQVRRLGRFPGDGRDAGRAQRGHISPRTPRGQCWRTATGMQPRVRRPGAGGGTALARYARWTRAQIVFARRRGGDAVPLRLDAANQLERVDDAQARAAYLEAIGAAVFAGRLHERDMLRKVVEAARAAPRRPRPLRPADALLDGPPKATSKPRRR